MDLRRYQGIKNRLSYYCKRDLTAIAARVVLERGWLAATLTGKTENRKVRRRSATLRTPSAAPEHLGWRHRVRSHVWGHVVTHGEL